MMTIFEQLMKIMKGKEHSIFTGTYIKNELHDKYGTNQSSVIPSDFCYNRINDGIRFRKDNRIFKYLQENSYEYLGQGFPYNGKIYHRPYRSKTDTIVGEWLNGDLNMLQPSINQQNKPSLLPNRQNQQSEKKIKHHTMTKKIIRPASLVKQGNLTLYATSLKVSDLLISNFYSIERLDPDNANERGYQRLLNKGRAKKLAEYIVAGQKTRDAFLPTSIFMATDKNIPYNPTNNTIEIDINEVCPFNIVDGQHRVEGLKMATEKDPSVSEFEVPVNIAINLYEIEQMCHFLIVNTTQKSVEEGLAQRIRSRLTKRLELENIPTLPKWILNSVEKGEDEKALQYVDFLNTENESPWYNKIKMSNEENSDGSINQKSFVKAIKKYILVVNNPFNNIESEERQRRIFLNYWKAITNIIGNDEPTVLFKYNGVELFCRFCVPFYNRIINCNDYKVSTMQNLLYQVFENTEGDSVTVGHTDFWIKGGTASGLNASALSKINNELVKALFKATDVKQDKELEI